MPGDYSRKLFNRANRYSGVLMQQGRVQLDADWNEQLDIQLYRTETEAIDVIGASGVPKKTDGFRISVIGGGTDLAISPGRIYVEGLLCELFEPTSYATQPFLPHPEFVTPDGSGLSLPDGSYLVFIDASLREVTARERAHRLIREVALGGPDTTTRLQTAFQVRLLPIGAGSPLSPIASPPSSPLTCKSPLPLFDAETALTTGKLNARTVPPQDEENACLLPPTAGYNRLENQLYRIEIHTGGSESQAMFKWSRNNASVESTIEDIDGSIITVSEVRKDEVLGFIGQQWVEIVDDESSLKNEPNDLVQIEKITPSTREITVKTSVAHLKDRPGLRLRGWDQTTNAGSQGLGTAGDWIPIEGGIQVKFLAGQYHAGDYWLIPGRTVTGEIEWPPFEIPNLNPVPQPPRGVRHHYARLALLEVVGGLPFVQDCREQFPSLTDICAEDVCYDNASCQLPGAETVQDALDRLCAERDLRFHKKHLHGWGIVCGLQVECGPDPSGQPRRHVTVKKGYAIDCEGNDVLVKESSQLDIVALATASGLLTPGSPPSSPVSPPGGLRDGDVCLVLNSGSNGDARYSLEEYPAHRTGTEEILRGTLLMDFFEDCIQSLVEFVRSEFTVPPEEEQQPVVGPTAKRLTTFGNLFIQLSNPENGSFVFLSGERNSTPEDREDTILRQFYARLRERLSSHTFCAMFENARPFPTYPYSDTNIRTIFSNGFKTRFRASPDGITGYSMGAGNTINVFDLVNHRMVARVEFPAASSAIVQDVAFSANGRELYAVATLNGRETLFAVADVTDFTVTFRNPVMLCDILLVTLATSPSVSAHVYAISKGQGLFEINPQNVNVTPQPIYPFAAVGHLVVHDASGNAFATVSTGGTAETYEAVVRLNLRTITNPANPPTFAVAAQDATGAIIFTSGEDDIALTSQANPSLYIASVLASTNTNKQVAVYNALAPNGSTTPSAFVDLGENTTIRMKHNPTTNHMMVTYEDSYRVGLITANHSLVSQYRHPVQISPLWIDMSPDRNRVYVLNFASNTISSIPAARLQPSQQLPLQDLVDYRSGVINAFADLAGGLLQYLKDCFCDHVLVNCPTCEDDDKLYLACITIKQGQVQKICNFSLRKYVHSFPTWEYWLSVIPILPFIRAALGRMCCAALPTLFGRFNAPRPKNAPDTITTGANRISGLQLRQGVTFTRETDFQAIRREETARARTGTALLGRTIIDRPSTQEAPALAQSDIANLPVDEAQRRLATAQVKVEGVEVYDPAEGATHVGRFITAPTRLREDARVVLVTDPAGKVLYYRRAEPTSPDVSGLRTDLENVRAEVAKVADTGPALGELRTRVDANTAALTSTQQTLTTTQQTLTATQASVEEALQLRQQIVSLQSELVQVRRASEEAQRAADRQIVELQSTSRDLSTRVEQLQRGLTTTPITPTTPATPIVTPGRRSRKKPPTEKE